MSVTRRQVLGALAAASTLHAQSKPNFVFLFADDLGWGDVGFNGRKEWSTPNLDRLGAQGTICAGGRYDGLLEELGGPAIPGIGFALGLERLVSMLAAAGRPGTDANPHAYLIMVGDAAQRQGLALAERLRDQLPALRLRMHCGGGGFKAQFRRADHSGARFALILGEDEVRTGTVAVKSLRDPDGQQLTLSPDQAAACLRAALDSTSSC